MKVGIVCEGGCSDGPALHLLLRAEFPDVTFVITGTSKALIFSSSGALVDALIDGGCERVYVLWDLHPIGTQMAVKSQTEHEKPCRYDQRKTLLGRASETASTCDGDLRHLRHRYEFETYKDAPSTTRVELVCFSTSFDAVFLADPVQLRRLASSKVRVADDAPAPKDLESIEAPAVILKDYFERGHNKRLRHFNKHQHNEVLAKEFVDAGRHAKLKRHPGYRRLIEKIQAFVQEKAAARTRKRR